MPGLRVIWLVAMLLVIQLTACSGRGPKTERPLKEQRLTTEAVDSLLGSLHLASVRLAVYSQNLPGIGRLSALNGAFTSVTPLLRAGPINLTSTEAYIPLRFPAFKASYDEQLEVGSLKEDYRVEGDAADHLIVLKLSLLEDCSTKLSTLTMARLTGTTLRIMDGHEDSKHSLRSLAQVLTDWLSDKFWSVVTEELLATLKTNLSSLLLDRRLC